MLRMTLSVTVAAVGLFLGAAGQRIWTDSPDEVWATVAVISVLWALAIAFEHAIARFLSPITGVTHSSRDRTNP